MSNIFRKITRNIATTRGLPRNAFNPSGIKARISQLRQLERMKKALTLVGDLEDRKDGE